MTQNAIASRQSIELIPVKAPAPWRAFRLELSAFPLSGPSRAALNFLIAKLIHAVSESHGLQPTLWLDTAELHRDGGARLFSGNARRWSPTMGFAFDPTGPAPRTLELSDLMDAPWGTPPKIYDRSAILVSAFHETAHAYRSIGGRGLASLLFFAAEPAGLAVSVDRFMRNSRATLEPMVASNSFKHHNFYLPLLSAASIAKATEQELQAWIGEVEIYTREVFEENEFLLLTRRNIAPLFLNMGMQRNSKDDESAVWTISFDSGSFESSQGERA